MHLHNEGLMIAVHIRAPKGAFQIFVVNSSMGQLMSNLLLLSSFQIEFERVINGLGGQNCISCQSKHGLLVSSVKTGQMFVIFGTVFAIF